MLIRYKAKVGNFGDDLNDVIWPYYFTRDQLDNPEHLLVGIGTILNNGMLPMALTERKRVTILGSGASYGALPMEWRRFEYVAVRGPLTASLIGKPIASATDPAIVLPRVVPFTIRRPAKDVLFIPHHFTVAGSNWEQICSTIGIKYVNPAWPVNRIIEAFSSARLVITEAMHGAIVADAYRIPWIPIFISAAINPFKWHDWARSINLSLAPHIIPPSSRWEQMRNERIWRTPSRIGWRPSQEIESDVSKIVESFQSGILPAEQPSKVDGGSIEAIKKFVTKVGPFLTKPLDQRRFDQSAARISTLVASGQQHLSSDTAFSRAEEIFLEKLNSYTANIA